jgi:hypothetical protein
VVRFTPALRSEDFSEHVVERDPSVVDLADLQRPIYNLAGKQGANLKARRGSASRTQTSEGLDGLGRLTAGGHPRPEGVVASLNRASRARPRLPSRELASSRTGCTDGRRRARDGESGDAGALDLAPLETFCDFAEAGKLNKKGLLRNPLLLAAWLHEYRREVGPPSSFQRLALMPLFAALAPVRRLAGFKRPVRP